jgi:hypothetical protein
MQLARAIPLWLIPSRENADYFMRIASFMPLLAAILCGCASNIQKAADTWVGQPENALVAKFGAPVATETLADGSTTESFDVQAEKRGPSYEMPMPGVTGAFYTVNGPSAMGTCRLTFTLVNQVVTEVDTPADCL